MKKLGILFFLAFLPSINAQSDKEPLIFYDEFDNLPSGLLWGNTGAHTEYHYLHEAAPKGNWALSTFRFGMQNSWGVQRDNDDKIIVQKRTYEDGLYYHPMIITGNEFWRDYTLEVRFAPEIKNPECGVAVRYKNDRNYYFFGVKGNKAILKMVREEYAFHKSFEKILDEKEFSWEGNKYLVAVVTVKDSMITAKFDNGPLLTATDTNFEKGKIALVADVPAKFSYVKVFMSEKAQQVFRKEVDGKLTEEKKLQAANPGMKLWKKINTYGFGVGRNLRFGDLDGDGVIDVLIGQVVHHGNADANSELSCLTAMTFDGKILWQIGKPDIWKDHLTNDVGFQIHDIDNDGKNEVVYCMNQKIHVVEGATGKLKYEADTPLKPEVDNNTSPVIPDYKRILGDCIYFCDLSGKGYASDIIIKDRYHNLWALNNTLQIIWHAACNTGHYPFAYDIDHDGKDELMMGYTLFSSDGKVLWSHDKDMQDHADGVAIAEFKNNDGLKLLCAASDEGIFFTDIKGNFLKHLHIGHVQNPTIANFRDDLPGLEVVSVNFWGNQGIIHYYDSDFNMYYDFEPTQYGSMMLPLNWTGKSEEYFVLNANVDEGGIYDGWGRKVLQFPDDGHPDMCNAVLDITGDCRDEIVVWDPNEIWVYTQDDNPKKGKLYKPKRNPLYNYSNYQANVSLPGWSEK